MQKLRKVNYTNDSIQLSRICTCHIKIASLSLSLRDFLLSGLLGLWHKMFKCTNICKKTVCLFVIKMDSLVYKILK